MLAHWLRSAQVHVLKAFEQLDDLLVRLLQAFVVANHGGMLGHGLPQLAPQLEGILSAWIVQQLGIDLGLPSKFSGIAAISVRGIQCHACT